MKKEILQSVEKHERITIKRRITRKSFLNFCDKCGRGSDWLSVEEATKLSGLSAEDVRENLKSIRKGSSEKK